MILDDATVYNTNHLLGFLSVFNGDAVKSIDMFKGAFPARYGGRLSSVIDMRMLEGDKKKYHGKFGMGLLSANLTVQGPIKKNKSSFLFSGRRNYIDLIINPFIKKEGSRLIFNFYDLNLKLNHEFSSKDKIYLSGYFGRDNMGVSNKYVDYNGYQDDNEFKISWGNTTAAFRWNHQFNPKIFANTTLIYSNYDLTQLDNNKFTQGEFKSKYVSKIQDLSFKYDLDVFLNPNHHIVTGIKYTNHFFKPGASVIKGTGIVPVDKVQEISTNEAAFYIEDRWNILNNLKANIGVRTSFFSHKKVSYYRPEPRISVAYSIKEDLSVKASFETMNQYIHLLSGSGLSVPTDLWVPSTENVKSQSSQQFALGVAKDYTEHDFSLSLEGYYKKSNNVIGYKEGANFLELGGDANSIREFDFEESIISGNAWAYGGEFLIQKKHGKLSGWVGYTLSWSQRQFNELNFGRKFNAKYDRRHDASIVAIYKASGKITLSANWVFGTGNNYTLANGVVKTVFNNPNDSNPNSGPTKTANYYIGKHNFRGESTHRLDLGVQFHKQKRVGKRTWVISIYNVYNRRNPYYYFIKTEDGSSALKRVSLLPIIPSITYKYEF